MSDHPDANAREEETPSILEEEPETDGTGGGALENLLDGLGEAGAEEVSVEDIVHAFEHRSIGALVSVVALISAMPVVGGIPGVTLVTATIILLVVAQSLFHKRGGLWMPGFLGNRHVKGETLRKGIEKVRPYARRADRWMHPRLLFLTHGRGRRLVITGAIIVLTLTWYPLDFIPWAVTVPSLAVLALGLALMTGDGYLALFGYAMAVATLVMGIVILPGGWWGKGAGGGGILSHIPLIGS